jgi:hypothetical protein
VAKNGNLDNMKWLLKNKFPYDTFTFTYATENGNLDNIKWLLENKFPTTHLHDMQPYDSSTFTCAA